MNIIEEHYDYAKTLGLDWIATGGGVDYINKVLPENQLALLADPEDVESPWVEDDTSPMEIPSTVLVVDADSWEQVAQPFAGTAEQYINYMAQIGDAPASNRGLVYVR